MTLRAWIAENLHELPLTWADEFDMLIEVGMREEDAAVALDRWAGARRVVSDWGYFRTVVWVRIAERRRTLREAASST